MDLSPSSGQAQRWKEKLSLWFRQIVECGRRILAGELSDFGPGAYQGAEGIGEQLGREGRISFPLEQRIFGPEIQPGTEISRDELVLYYLTFIKYGRSLPELLKQRDAGSWDASQKLLRVFELSERLAFSRLRTADKRLLYGGEFKRVHRGITELGVSFGLLELTESELVEFFDYACPCGNHKLENMKKLRQRVWTEMQRSSATAGKPQAPGPAPAP